MSLRYKDLDLAEDIMTARIGERRLPVETLDAQVSRLPDDEAVMRFYWRAYKNQIGEDELSHLTLIGHQLQTARRIAVIHGNTDTYLRLIPKKLEDSRLVAEIAKYGDEKLLAKVWKVEGVPDDSTRFLLDYLSPEKRPKAWIVDFLAKATESRSK